ncbi:MAG TPA: PQQ-binding-like beta-propeller repeat protein [Planctomycetota bacterium]|nr:PQQ-binding-like beta-propeller repeat protein [Planctomycetota bacterium]
MYRRRERLILLKAFATASFCFLLPILRVHAGEDGLIASPEKGWPQWRGIRRDGISDEKNLLASWPAEGPKLLWKFSELGRGWSSPIIVGDSIYITGDVAGEVGIFCLDLQGKQKWKAANGSAWMKQYPGSRASCAYSEGVVYHMNGFGRVAAYDAASGKELWNNNVLKTFESATNIWGLSECLLIDGPRVIVTPGGPKTLMAALDKKTGATVWTSEPIPAEKAAYSSPILFSLGGRRIIANCSSRFGFGVDADTGKLLWKVPNENRWGATCCAPILADRSIFYSAPDGPCGVMFNLKSDGDTFNADVAWRTQVDPLTGSGILMDGLLFTSGCKKSTSLHALDVKTGESRYEIKVSTPTNNHATAAMVWAEGRLYTLFENGIVQLLKPAGDKFEVAGQFKLIEKTTEAWAHPVLLDGRLYLRHHETLWCYDVRQ